MITIGKNEFKEIPITEVAALYIKNRNHLNKNVDDFIELLEYIKIDIQNILLVPYAPYWDFLDEVANNIDSGKWVMHPYMWKTYIMNATYSPMTEQAVMQRCNALRARCIQILESHEIPVNGLANRQLLLLWSRNPNGFQDILSTVKTMVELNKLFSKKGNDNV